MSTGYASVRSLAGRKQARTISWVMTAAAIAFLLAVIVAHASGSTAQQVAIIARMGGQPGFMTFLCAECGMADGLWWLAPITPSEEIASVRAVTEPHAR